MLNTSSIAVEQYVCPHCFKQGALNHVFFRRNVMKNTPDFQQSRLYRMINGEAELPGFSYALADWQTCSLSRRRLEGDVITGLIDNDGDQLRQRVCPSCHFPLPDHGHEAVTILPWDNGKISPQRFRELLEYMRRDSSRWRALRRLPDPINNPVTTIQVSSAFGCTVSYPEGIVENERRSAQILLDRYIRKANIAAVWVRLDHAEEEPASDDDAVWSLQRYMEQSGIMAGEMDRPLVIFAEADNAPEATPEQFHEWMVRMHPVLMQRLLLSMSLFIVLPWNEYKECSAAYGMAFLLSRSGIPVPDEAWMPGRTDEMLPPMLDAAPASVQSVQWRPSTLRYDDMLHSADNPMDVPDLSVPYAAPVLHPEISPDMPDVPAPAPKHAAAPEVPNIPTPAPQPAAAPDVPDISIPAPQHTDVPDVPDMQSVLASISNMASQSPASSQQSAPAGESDVDRDLLQSLQALLDSKND